MLLLDNLMHADLHPGNILIYAPVDEKTGLQTGQPFFTIVDAGMVATLTDSERENFIGLLEAIGQGNGLKAGRFVLNFSTAQVCEGRISFLGSSAANVVAPSTYWQISFVHYQMPQSPKYEEDPFVDLLNALS